MVFENADKKSSDFPNIYQTYIDWFTQNFVELGLSKQQAVLQGQQLLSAMQGAIHVSHIMADVGILRNFSTTELEKINQL